MFIQTENTPNPLTLKFIPGQTILEKGTLEFKSNEESKNHKLAEELFSTGDVTNVFVGKDFISITKTEKVEWEHVKPSFLSIIMNFFSSGGDFENKEKDIPSKEKIVYSESEQEIVNKVIQLIEERVKPAVAQDGGDISFVSFKDGVVFLELQGACSGCPSSTMTLKSGIENMLKYYVPEVESVEPIN
ncbi:MAG: NifU family protein [Alphaproteobacteria bacterium]